MKQMLLVDDDFLSLNAFYSLADWRAHGLCIAMEAHNGREAADYLKSSGAEIDAAFIDVCMPNMDGIALLHSSSGNISNSTGAKSSSIRFAPFPQRSFNSSFAIRSSEMLPSRARCPFCYMQISCAILFIPVSGRSTSIFS